MRVASRLAAHVVLLLLSVFGLQAQSENGKRPHTLHAFRVTEKVTVDGNLNEGAWAKAPVEWDFTQRDPIEGKEPSERTEVRIIYDDTSIYFGVRLFDREPQKIVWRKTTPDRFTRDRNVWVAKWWTWNYGRKITGDGFNAAVNAQFLNYWNGYVSFGLSRQVQDDGLTRGGQSSLNLGGRFVSFGFNSDSRKKISFNGSVGTSRNKPSAWNGNVDLGVTYKPSPAVTISVGPNFSRSRGNAQYMTSVTDATATRTYGGRYVFADIDQTAASLTTRVNWIF